MTSAPAFQPAASGTSRTAAPRQRLVTDAPTRVFHWLFALSFVGAYLSADGERWRALHVTFGYTMLGLLAFRLLYGLFGPPQARLRLMLRRLGGVGPWSREVVRAIRQGALQGIALRQGQNLAMALAAAVLLVMVVPVTLSGYASYQEWGDVLGGEWIEELHEFLGEAMLAVVLAHLALITGLSVLRRRNQAQPMWSGRIDGAGPDLVKRNHAWLAALLLVAVVGFFGWQWQQYPQGLLPAQATTGAASDRHHDDDD